ncbi:DNA polymerase epsilon catalytic subunit A [Neolecta irregularis DAH-3]|uniref:DNA polymerase epsilon catalytic subunit n=1 Tax=Neolecta irregularis (strain DAH-3) TaxID=1198029 RepID=A0A1U7LTV4_NEOID|nr:DNA polymerase epsilon catalytic subunit A [Neolecta irregularis DAH-3]|eukprot:OLL26048.1 DNA polymerase epsilon catalytic subunit A [Neolecta irregularis DAH-3]
MTSQNKSYRNREARLGRGSYRSRGNDQSSFVAIDKKSTVPDIKVENRLIASEIDEKMGFIRYEAGHKREGWLINMHSTTITDEAGASYAAVDFYFLQDDGGSFKAAMKYEPYFLIASKRGKETEVEEYIRRRFEGLVVRISRVKKEDLRIPNHLTGYRRTFTKLLFNNVNDLLQVRRVLSPIALANHAKLDALDAYAEAMNDGFDSDDDDDENNTKMSSGVMDAQNFIVDIREFDVPYHVRVAIDKDIRVGKWYTVSFIAGDISIEPIEDRLNRAEPVVLAFDIETTKLPLKFPDPAIDQVMMISYMIDGQGYLITNREIVSRNISDFEYTPKPEYPGPFAIYNEPDEKATLIRFFEHIQDSCPTVIVTYNGDFFDWPFIDARARKHGINMHKEIGFMKDNEDEYKSYHCAHMDCYRWVKRDSYLPQGSQGLKAVTTAKLGYDPHELDPELMTIYAEEKPQVLAEYSVSDAVSTYYLYMKYIHPFIFSLCNIIPLGPDDVLRKGTGTLCEMLLMVQAYQKEIILPNKHAEEHDKFYEGHLLESETYVGGHVESLEAGVFRNDIPVDFKIDTSVVDELLNDLETALKFTIEVEEHKIMQDITNYDEVKKSIVNQLEELKINPSRKECPKIYHLDVASMYPNIMITNRLQPDSMIDESTCAACDFNKPGKTCDRRLPWSWRGEYFPAKRNEYNMIRHTLENEMYPGKYPGSSQREFSDLSTQEQSKCIHKRLSEYSRKVYHKIRDNKVVEKEAIICQRENPFYIDTVKSFRDRRYDYKGHQKSWKRKVESLQGSGNTLSMNEADKMVVLYDSLQLAHKVILNSFYGYVMRKGSRWYSMEMAGVTCLTGASIIQMARQLIERIGRPLELDTDGIWCIIPDSFPENFTFELQNDKKITISYPCVILNYLVHTRFTNHQYQDLVDPEKFRYQTHSENSIFFEVDGPYRAMILPTSKEEGKNLKKRYAVFNQNGTLAELKGFEIKRRGELNLVKSFQKEVFKSFLEGTTLTECYAAVGKIADRWLDILYTRGENLQDDELLNLICENRSMSRTLEDYGAQKSTSISTAKRLAEFLGEQMVKDKGLACKYIIAAKPKDAPVTERAIPVAIFSAEEPVKKHFLQKWQKDKSLSQYDLREVLDWDYYLERLGSVIQKLVTMPAAMQKVPNPVPRVKHPDWLQRNLKNDHFKQYKLSNMFQKISTDEAAPPRKTNLQSYKVGYDINESVDISSLDNKGFPQKAHDKAKMAISIEVPEEIPSMYTLYPKWLKYQKKKWIAQRNARNRRRILFGTGTMGRNDLATFFRTQTEVLSCSTWHILQIRETSIPGELRAWVLVDGKIFDLRFIAPRRFYVNLKDEDLPNVEIPDCSVEKVQKVLPNGRSSVHLFEMSLPEPVFQTETRNFATILNHPSVEGIYEQRLPLRIRAILEVGCQCSFQASVEGSLGRGLDKGFDLASLDPVNSKQSIYLDKAQVAYVYVCKLSVNERIVYGIFSAQQDSVDIVIVDADHNPQNPSNLDNLYHDLLSQHQSNMQGTQLLSLIDYGEAVSFRIVTSSDKKKAFKVLAEIFQRHLNDLHLPVILVIECPDKETLFLEIPQLNDHPFIELPARIADRQLPSIGWQNHILKRMISHYLEIGAWLFHRLELSRYANIPICDISSSPGKFSMDIIFARKLRQSNYVLWWSATPKPDFGGHEQDEFSCVSEFNELLEIQNTGAFSTVCIDIKVQNLAINTLMTSSLINELEGALSGSFTVNDVNQALDDDQRPLHITLGDNSFSNSTISILKDMLRGWWEEARFGVSMADYMVQHLLQWIQSTDSFLFNKSLYQHVQILTRKSFLQLMSEFRRIGSRIVHANPSRIVLQTNKLALGNAFSYSQYIVKAIKSKPLFHFLDLEITEYWDYLLWMDRTNYGGMSTKNIPLDSDNIQLETVFHWQLEKYLPPAIQGDFRYWAVKFVETMHAIKMNDVSNLSSQHGNVQRNSSQVDAEVELKGLEAGVLNTSFAKPLRKQITQLYRRHTEAIMDTTDSADFAFPNLPGSHLHLTNPTLELIKSLCAVFALAKNLNLEVRVLRRDLLSILAVPEYSKDAIFEDYCAKYNLHNVSCEYCNLSQDIDLCRDGKIFSGNNHDNENQPPQWTCSNCAHAYSQIAIEEQIIIDLQQNLMSYQIQDIRCQKCKQAKIDNIQEYCSCSGTWVCTIKKSAIIDKLIICANIAQFYKLAMLQNVTEEIKALGI